MRWQKLSPHRRVRPGMIPTIVFHGTGDTMLKAGNRCELVTTESAAHGMPPVS